jgi:hypothetical protein
MMMMMMMMMMMTERLDGLGDPPMRTMMMSDVQSIDSLASEDGHGASISKKPWADTAPDDQHGEVDEAVAKLGGGPQRNPAGAWRSRSGG